MMSHDPNRPRRLLAEALIADSSDALIALTPDGEVLVWNQSAERLFGHRERDAVGRKLDDLIGPSPHDRPPGIEGAPTQRRNRDGQPVEVEITRRVVPASAETAEFITITAHAVGPPRLTHEKERFRGLLEEQNRRVQEANRLKSEFLANMSHELRTPLNAIIGFAELMHKGKVGPVSPDHQEYLGDILSSSRHLLQLINDVLDLAKVESGKIELRPEPLVLADVVSEVRDILLGLATIKRIRIDSQISPALSQVVLDAAKLKQVLYNYLSNAIKFTPENGRVVVRIEPATDDSMFRIDVEDNGIGIRPEDLARLFVEFQQLDAGIAEKYAGTGLGLVLTKRLVEAQGGSVEVRSTPGVGSTFSALLPIDLTRLSSIHVG